MTAEDLLHLLDAEIPTITADRSDLARLATLTRYAQTCLRAVELADISRRIRALEQTLADRS